MFLDTYRLQPDYFRICYSRPITCLAGTTKQQSKEETKTRHKCFTAVICLQSGYWKQIISGIYAWLIKSNWEHMLLDKILSNYTIISITLLIDPLDCHPPRERKKFSSRFSVYIWNLSFSGIFISIGALVWTWPYSTISHLINGLFKMDTVSSVTVLLTSNFARLMSNSAQFTSKMSEC